MDLALQLLANSAAKFAVYGILACGFGLLYRSLRVFNIAFGGLIVAGPYLTFWLIIDGGFPPVAAAAVGVAGTIGAALVAEALVFRSLDRRGAGAEGGMIASIGVYAAAQGVIGILFGYGQNLIPLFPRGSVTLGPVYFAHAQTAQVATGAVALAAITAFAGRARLWTLLRALGDDPELLVYRGGRPDRLRMGAWTIAAALAAIGGLITAADVGVDPRSGLQLFLGAAVAVFLGGQQRLAGWLLGALCVAMFESTITLWFEAKWAPTFVYSVTLILLAVRPSGLVGARREARPVAL
jgi:branched-chain amino acid transport system permease protein